MNCPNPKCRAALKPGARFCPSCGTRVESGVEAVAEAQKPASSAPPVPPAPPAPPAAAPRPEPASVASGTMLCRDRLTVLFEGCPCIVRFRMDAARFGADARNIRFLFENQLTGCKLPIIRPRGRRDRPLEFCVTFPEQKAGAFVWYVTVEYECGGRRKSLEGEISLVVERQGEARKVADQLAVNINTTITTGHAADVHLNQSAADALDKIVKSPDDPFKALRKLVEGHERAWAEVGLFESDISEAPTRPGPVLPPKGPERLTLACGDEVVQLVSDGCVTFGRKRDNVIPLRVCGADGRVDRQANEGNLSRFHFCIERIGNDCVLKDGAADVPSSYGTRVNGEQLPPLGMKRLAAGCATEIEAGRSGVALKMRAVFHRDSHGRAAGFVLDRLDGARQRTCAVWGELPLGDGASVLWDGFRWTLKTGPSGQVPISVGAKVLIGGRLFDVQPFHQTPLN